MVTAVSRREITTRSRATMARKPTPVSVQTSGETSENTGRPPKAVSDDRFEGLFRPGCGASRTGGADEALRDDDAAAKEYSPSGAERNARRRDRPGTARGGGALWRVQTRCGCVLPRALRRLRVEGSIPARRCRHHEVP